MTYSDIQLDIIRTFGSKELSEGCLINTDKGIKNLDDHFIIGTDNKLYRESRNGNEPYLYSQTCETLGHIPHLNDIFRIAKDKFADTDIHMNYLVFFSIDPMLTKDTEGMYMIPYNQLLSILDQDEQLTLIPLLNIFN